MKNTNKNPRILVVTPEITYLPDGMEKHLNCRNAKAGGLADVSAALISALYRQGADIHVAVPDYRRIFNGQRPEPLERELGLIRSHLPENRVHLAEDRAFFYLNHVYSRNPLENINISLAFQREVIHHIIPRVQPDLIHCNDWMTGLIPAAARKAGLFCLFSVHNIHTVSTRLSHIEDRGIDAASFWENLYFEEYPVNYEHARNSIPVDFLASGVFAAHFVNTVSPSFLVEIIRGQHGFVPPFLRRELANKYHAGCATGILNAPDDSFHPARDNGLYRPYTAKKPSAAKKINKQHLQHVLGLVRNPDAPVFFWPSRLDPVQKGCRLLADILYAVVDKYWETGLQVVFVADGPFHRHFRQIADFHHLKNRIAVCRFDEGLSRLAYGAADFVLMPSAFEPCGLPQMIGAIYGALPIAHNTGGIHDTVAPLDVNTDTGNGFLFDVHDAGGLFWAIDQAMEFFLLPEKMRDKQIRRIMTRSAERFNHQATARQYIDLYERMLNRPLVDQKAGIVVNMPDGHSSSDRDAGGDDGGNMLYA